MKEGPRVATLDLVARAQAGDANAREELFGRCIKQVTRLVAARWGVPLERLYGHEDLVQEGLQRILENLGRFRPRSEGGFWAWASRVVCNRLTDLHREVTAEKRTGAGVVPMVDLGSDARSSRLPGANDPVSKRMRVLEDREILDVALMKLQESYRDVLIERYLCGMTYAEIAELHDSNEDAIRAKHSRAISQLLEVTRHLRAGDHEKEAGHDHDA